MAKISFVLLLSGLMLVSCQQKESKKTVTEEASINAENQEVTAVVYYFHGTRRCPTCIKVGEIARATVENNFKKEIEEGKVKFEDINVEDGKHDDLVEKFQIKWNALIIRINSKEGEEISDLTDMAFQYANTSPDEVEAAIKTKLYKFLNQ